MRHLTRLFFVIALLTSLAVGAHAQAEGEVAQDAQTAATAAGKPARKSGALRVPASGKAGQVRLEVYNASGGLVYDSGFQKGELNWSLQDLGGQTVADGSYRLQISYKGETGQVSNKDGSVTVESAQITSQTGVPDEANLAVDTEIVFAPAAAGQQTYGRDIRLSDNKGGLRFYAMPSMTSVPQGAALQFFGNQSPYFPGQAFFDSGAHDQAAFIVRTAPSNGTVAERMRVNAFGNVGIGTAAPTERLEVAGNFKLSGAGSGITFADGSRLTTAPTGGGAAQTGNDIIAKINDPATTTKIQEGRLPSTFGKVTTSNSWAGIQTFQLGLNASNSPITNVGLPSNPGDAANKSYVDATTVKFVPGAEQLSVGDANGTAPMINLRGGSTCCSGPGGHTPAFFKVFQNGSFVATGNLGIGTSPMEGKGYRTSWHTYKGAFRSGYADNEWDDANVGFFSWAGGSNSTASGLYALAFGDTNFARSTSSIAFGSGNEVKGAAGFSAGAGNRVCDTYGVALGNNARSGGPYIDGKCDPETFNIRGLAAVAIGYNVTADQDHTTAMGKFASNNGFQGTFIWSDGAAQASADTFRNTANNEFAARATGGFRFRTNLGGTTGCNLPAGSGVFNCTSSRTTKENFLAVSGEDILTRMRKVPVSTWNYITEGQQVRHLGPMAEDFHAAFKLGTDEKSIGVLDIAGVSFAAIKALEERTAELREKTAEVEKLRSEVEQLRAANAANEQRLSALEKAIQAGGQK